MKLTVILLEYKSGLENLSEEFYGKKLYFNNIYHNWIIVYV